MWESVDYEVAAVALESTAPANLPTASSPAFARITASANFDIFADKSRPLSSRLTENAASTRALMRIMKVYLDNSAHGERFVRERLMFMIAGLHAMVVQWQTVEEAGRGLDPKDPNHATRMDSLARMRQESGRQVERLLSGLDPREDCDTVRWYAGALQKDFAELVARTSEVDRDKARRRVQEIVDEQSRPECKAAVAELLRAFENKP